MLNDIKNFICDKCGKPVDKVEVIHNRVEDSITHRFYCHGEIKEVKFHNVQIAEVTIYAQEQATTQKTKDFTRT